MKKEYSIDVAGRTLTVQTGQLAQLANGAVLVKYEILWFYLLLQRLLNQGRDRLFPLSVDYEEKMYSVGRS